MSRQSRIERWFGPEQWELVSLSMRNWPGPPILLGNLPRGSKAFVGRDGEVFGSMRGGSFASILDWRGDRLAQYVRYVKRRGRAALRRWWSDQKTTFQMAGFTSLSGAMSAASQSPTRKPTWIKHGTTRVIQRAQSLWAVGSSPPAGSNGGAAPGGTAHTSSDTGAMPFYDPAGGEFLQVVSGFACTSQALSNLMVYDRLFSVAKTMNSTSNENVTGVPSRYQNTTPNQDDSVAGNFLMVETTTTLAATAHNWDAQITDQDGNTAVDMPTLTGNSANAANNVDHPLAEWYWPFASGDTGIKALTRMTCSANVATGAINFVIGHPLIYIPIFSANHWMPMDLLNEDFDMPRVFPGACLALLDLVPSSTTAANVTGLVKMLAGTI